MKHLGPLFRVLREERGFTLKNLSEGIVSYSYLSKFEKGKAQISANNLILLLQRMNLTVDEFLYFNRLRMNDYQAFFQKISNAHIQQDLEKLKEYYQDERALFLETNINFHKYNAIMIAAVIQDLNTDFLISEKEIQQFVDYLLACSFWTTYEISLFGNSLTLFSEELLIVLLEEIKKRISDYQVMRKNIRDLIRLLQNAALIFLRKRKAKQAEKISDFLTNVINSDHYFEKTRQLFITGLIVLLQGQKEKGMKKAQEAIEIMEILDESLAKSHRIELDSYRNV